MTKKSETVLLLISCTSDTPDLDFPGVTPTNIRLKHLTTTEEFVAALGTFAEGWDVDELQIKREQGTYPTITWEYQSDLYMGMDGPNGKRHSRKIRIETTGAFEMEEIKELERWGNYVEVKDARLDNYPSLYVNKSRDNDAESWRFRLYAHQVFAPTGNRTTDMIWLSGGGPTIPPPTDAEAVTAMLNLLTEME